MAAARERPCGICLQGRYIIDSLLGAGSFGQVYSCCDKQTGHILAVKLASSTADHDRLAHEATVYRQLAGLGQAPAMHFFGREGIYAALVMDLLGPSLGAVQIADSQRVSGKHLWRLAEQMLDQIEYLHSRHFIHRDITPHNFMFDVHLNRLHLIDFGCAALYRDPETLEHVPYSEGGHFLGTAAFASVNAHFGRQQSRRDDLEALGYLLLHLSGHALPWNFAGCGSHVQLERVAQVKRETQVEDLCLDVPPALVACLQHCRQLRFDEEPSYMHLRRSFKACHNDGAMESLGVPMRQAVPDQGVGAVVSAEMIQGSAVEEVHVLQNRPSDELQRRVEHERRHAEYARFL